MNSNVWRILGSVAAICMAVISIVGYLSMDTCPQVETAAGGSMPMRCHWAFIAESWVAIIGITTSLLGSLAKTKEARRATSIATIVCALICIALLTPAGIGICSHDDSACHVPAYAIWAISAAIIVISAVQLAKCDPEAVSKPKRTLS